MKREESLERIRNRQQPWDVVVIGGGATGMTCAWDAATRGLDVLLVEQSDFGKGTSSRSTKLVHGGVRYLEQGNLTLVRDALRERSTLRRLAPMLVHDLPFFIPCRSRWQRFYFWMGLKLYDWLAGRSGFGRSRVVAGTTAQSLLPTLRPEMHAGGVIYHDGQFDDCRLLIHIARTAVEHDACLINYMPATGLRKDSRGRIDAVELRDLESGQSYVAPARVVINAAGPFSDAIVRLDDPSSEPRLAASQGVHLVLPRDFFPGETALIVPRTSDGRVLFMIPWHDHVVVGTTDTAIDAAVLEPVAQPQEIEFLLATSAQYLTRPPTLSDVTSVFTGVRPLVKSDRSQRTASLSRDHSIALSAAGLVTIRGGKWTTVRKMAEDCVDRAIESVGLQARPCQTHTTSLYPLSEPDAIESSTVRAPAGRFESPDAEAIARLVAENPPWQGAIAGLPLLRQVDVVWAARHEMARTVEDVLARRSRWLFLNAPAAVEAAGEVARILGKELGRDAAWQADQVASFTAVAQAYLPSQYQ